MVNLNGREVPLIKVGLGTVGLPEFLTDIAIGQTGLDLIPVLCAVDPLLQPVGVVSQPILLVPFFRKDLSGPLVGDDKGEDGEAKKEDYEEEHHHQVDPQEPCNATPGADEAGQGHHHEEDSDGDDGSIQKLLAVGAGPCAQPDSSAQDRN